MKVEIIYPWCNKNLQVIIPGGDIDVEDSLNELKEDQAVLEQELFVKHNILLG